MIRKAKKQDIPDIIKIHQVSLPNDLLPSFGTFVMSDYYKRFLSHNIIFLFEEEGETIGFIAVSVSNVDLDDILVHNIRHVLKGLLKKPALCIECIGLLFLKNKATSTIPEISFIAVEPKMRNMKIGSNLLFHTINYLKTKHFKRITVKTDTKKVESNLFYIKNNFKVIDVENRFRRNLYIYERVI